MTLGWRHLQHPDLLPEEALAVEQRVEEVLRSWKGTPYMAGQRCKGVAVDCVRFLAGVADELYGFERAPIDRLPHDMALHSPQRARAALRRILRIYSPLTPVTDGITEPGDALVVGPISGGPGHVIFVGNEPGAIWHAGTRRVSRTDISVLSSTSYRTKIFCIYRPSDKNRWLNAAVR